MYGRGALFFGFLSISHPTFPTTCRPWPMAQPIPQQTTAASAPSSLRKDGELGTSSSSAFTIPANARRSGSLSAQYTSADHLGNYSNDANSLSQSHPPLYDDGVGSSSATKKGRPRGKSRKWERLPQPARPKRDRLAVRKATSTKVNTTTTTAPNAPQKKATAPNKRTNKSTF